MAETADATVTPLRPKSRAKAKDPTNATRQRRHRAKKTATPVTVSAALAENIPAETSSNIKATVTALPLPTLPASSSPAMPGTDTAPYTAPAAHNGADVMAYTAAIALAGAAAWFSIRGMVLLFPGAPLSVVGMACAMEVAKLVTAGWLARRWRSTLWVWRGVLVALVAALAVINAAGVYAQLVAAHIGERGAAVSAIETQDATLAARIDVAAGRLADLDRQISQIDGAVAEAMKRGKTNAAVSVMEGQRKPRAALAGERQRAAEALATLKADRASVAAHSRQIETDAAPIRYAAELLGVAEDNEQAIKWLIALMVLCCDPLAIVLTAAASSRRAA